MTRPKVRGVLIFLWCFWLTQLVLASVASAIKQSGVHLFDIEIEIEFQILNLNLNLFQFDIEFFSI